jgi:putative sterol carrier protein
MATTQQYVDAMKRTFQASRAGGLSVTYQLQVDGPGGGDWSISINNGRCNIKPGAPDNPDVSITLSAENYLKLAAGTLNVMSAYRQGQLQVGGNTQLALKFTELFPPWASLVQSEPVPPPPAAKPAQTKPLPPQTISPPPAASPAPAEPSLADYVAAMPNGLRTNKVGNVETVYQFQLSGSGGGTWTVTIANGQAIVASGAGSANVTIGMSGSDFIRLARGNLNTAQAYQQGRVQISGDMNLAAKITDFFRPWGGTVSASPISPPAQPPAPSPAPSTPTAPSSTPVEGSVFSQLMNGSFDEYQPFVYQGEAKVWKESQFPEQFGKYWNLKIHGEGRGRPHLMSSAVFGPFTQKYFGGGGRDYHIHGHNSQVITSRYSFKITLSQTIAVQPGRDYTFNGSIVSFYKGTSGERADGKIFKSIGIDPTGGREYYNDTVIWSDRDGKDNEWRYPSLTIKAQAEAITVFILLENEEEDVGSTELNTIHLDHFELK